MSVAGGTTRRGHLADQGSKAAGITRHAQRQADQQTPAADTMCHTSRPQASPDTRRRHVPRSTSAPQIGGPTTADHESGRSTAAVDVDGTMRRKQASRAARRWRLTPQTSRATCRRRPPSPQASLATARRHLSPRHHAPRVGGTSRHRHHVPAAPLLTGNGHHAPAAGGFSDTGCSAPQAQRDPGQRRHHR